MTSANTLSLMASLTSSAWRSAPGGAASQSATIQTAAPSKAVMNPAFALTYQQTAITGSRKTI